MVLERPHPTQSLQPCPSRSGFVTGFSLVVGVGLLLLAGRLLRRVVVSGDSMRPAFEPGDRLLIVPAFRVQQGQVVALPDPRHSDRLLVKRVRSVRSGLVEVMGDNDGASTDSRHFGPVRRSSVVGRVVYRYAPSGRVGRIGRRRA
jgi:nickel-type superoxide dismutase maturation protease